jgi:hypothetical protein
MHALDAVAGGDPLAEIGVEVGNGDDAGIGEGLERGEVGKTLSKANDAYSTGRGSNHRSSKGGVRLRHET